MPQSVFDVPPLFVFSDILGQELSLFMVQADDSAYDLQEGHCLVKTSWGFSLYVSSYHVL